tara:strand:- start:1815 stop:2018 length:204 start_codon:yes stop_codon:yes gene_type:complete
MVKKKYRQDITDDIIEYCLQKSQTLRDKKWPDVLNAIAPVPPSGRTLKVVYKRKGKSIKMLTAYWLN